VTAEDENRTRLKFHTEAVSSYHSRSILEDIARKSGVSDEDATRTLRGNCSRGIPTFTEIATAENDATEPLPTEIDEAVGDVEGGLESSPLDAAAGSGDGGGRVRVVMGRPDDDGLVAAALRHELDVHAGPGRVDGDVGPAAAVGADRLAGVRRPVVDPHVVERTAAAQTHTQSPVRSKQVYCIAGIPRRRHRHPREDRRENIGVS